MLLYSTKAAAGMLRIVLAFTGYEYYRYSVHHIKAPHISLSLPIVVLRTSYTYW